MIKEAINELSLKNNLTPDLMRKVMEEIMTGKAKTAEIVSFLDALNKKGETVEEITAAVSVMRNHVTKIRTDKDVVLDTCGTGGDKKGTFNVSTLAAFVASGAGITVAKHGNRSVSSSCGSADILEALGVNINMPKKNIEECLNDIGIAFLYAPNLHPAMKYAMPARKQMGVRTIFNILGPLTNPAGATHQLLGVYEIRWVKILATVLGNLGTTHALVVHSQDGLDEVSTTARTYVSETYQGSLKDYEINPQDFGFPKVQLEDLRGKEVCDNTRIVLDVLKGEAGPKRDIVLLNAAAAIYAADKAKSLEEGIKMASESIDSGKALEKLEALKEYSQKNK
ncbi:MAG: anthranilate phosphoribosyltransferase [Candidatus Omnitrophica bacterium]|nr:anthranilate phosphoribosyltransferase [Candidatus Omnitrophota bacterium]MDD5592355.1 anthranilate phosphoribosyltransferase [Candidatus Omnitrophota bacterium]